MNTKEKVYQYLSDAVGPVSGENMAEKLHLSRTAVWKAIKALQNEGHEILAKPKEGYSLLKKSINFNTQSIINLLDSHIKSDVFVFDTIDSTNIYAKKIAEENAKDWTLIIAKNQSAGRGRFERNFYSPQGGLYMSFIIHPKIKLEDINLITMNVALAVCNAVKKYFNLDLGIKWVNDLFLNDKKVVGILTEAAIDFESKTFKYIVVGIGINLKLTDVPVELAELITDINVDDDFDKNLLVAEIVNSFYKNLSKNKKELAQEYRSKSIVLNEEVLIFGNYNGQAKVIDITDDGELLVITSDQQKLKLNSGEISLRRLNYE